MAYGSKDHLSQESNLFLEVAQESSIDINTQGLSGGKIPDDLTNKERPQPEPFSNQAQELYAGSAVLWCDDAALPPRHQVIISRDTVISHKTPEHVLVFGTHCRRWCKKLCV